MVAQPDYTVDATGTQGSTAYSLVASVYRRTLSPNAPGALQSGDIITLLDEEMRSTIVPLVLAAQEEFFVMNSDQALVNGTYSYFIPQRAAFAMWRDVVLVDANGNEINMTQLSPEYTKLTYPAGGNPPQYVYGFILANDHITLWPPNGSVPTQYTLRMKIKRRPNSLTPSANCGQITAINLNTGDVTLANVDTTWTTAITFDVIPNAPQFTSKVDGAAITAINTTTKILTFSTANAALFAVGDWVCPATMSPIPQIPYDMFPLLAQRGAIKVLEALGDTQNLQVAERRYQDMSTDFARTVSPRIDGTPKKIVSRNQSTFFGGYFPFQR